jgi:hypothetical protein
MRRPQAISILLLLLCSASPLAQKSTKDNERAHGETSDLPAVLWRDPGDISSLNLTYGAGGRAHAPDPKGTYTFVREDRDGTNPKFDVKDDAGMPWRVKLGEESQTETAATRLLWAAGYFVDEDYYLPEVTITGLPPLHRGQAFVSPGGKVHGAGFERRPKDGKKRGNWDWFANPFHETRDENALQVMMALLNNWDLKQVNNSIYDVDGERRYVVSDVGATFGNTGNYFTRSKSVLPRYEATKFVEHTTPGFVDFVLHSRPFVLTIFSVRHYREYARMEQLVHHIPRNDARWLGERLSLLSDGQLRDCFRAAGYTADKVEGYTKVIRDRIAALKTL